jgi:hypothetical protein
MADPPLSSMPRVLSSSGTSGDVASGAVSYLPLRTRHAPKDHHLGL